MNAENVDVTRLVIFLRVVFRVVWRGLEFEIGTGEVAAGLQPVFHELLKDILFHGAGVPVRRDASTRFANNSFKKELFVSMTRLIKLAESENRPPSSKEMSLDHLATNASISLFPGQSFGR